MEFEWEPEKAKRNFAKHGIAFESAEHFDWSRHVRTIDRRFDYGERRFKALGKINGRVHALVYAEYDSAYRLISLRKANSREVRFYEQNV